MSSDPQIGVDPDILIVGAGPTGLALAAQLDLFGIRFRIVDRSVDRARESLPWPSRPEPSNCPRSWDSAARSSPRATPALRGFFTSDRAVCPGAHQLLRRNGYAFSVHSLRVAGPNRTSTGGTPHEVGDLDRAPRRARGDASLAERAARRRPSTRRVPDPGWRVGQAAEHRRVSTHTPAVWRQGRLGHPEARCARRETARSASHPVSLPTAVFRNPRRCGRRSVGDAGLCAVRRSISSDRTGTSPFAAPGTISACWRRLCLAGIRDGPRTSAQQ